MKNKALGHDQQLHHLTIRIAMIKFLEILKFEKPEMGFKALWLYTITTQTATTSSQQIQHCKTAFLRGLF